uniref:Uncharacterized protein n=1 Tax=Vitis vinifera TaxID=29760 RepID=F6HYD5_VITVI
MHGFKIFHNFATHSTV